MFCLLEHVTSVVCVFLPHGVAFLPEHFITLIIVLYFVSDM